MQNNGKRQWKRGIAEHSRGKNIFSDTTPIFGTKSGENPHEIKKHREQKTKHEREKTMERITPTKENLEKIIERIIEDEVITDEEANCALTFAELWARLGNADEAAELYKMKLSSRLRNVYGYANSISLQALFEIFERLKIA